MKRLLDMVGMSIGGSIGWWLGDLVGVFTALFLSCVFSLLGFFAVRWLEREYLD